MASSTTNLRNPVKRLHSINRQKEYVTPTKRDVLCPEFPRLFIKTGKADVTNTYCAMCDNADVSCDYRETKVDTHFCKRYIADPTLDLELVKKVPDTIPAVWQDVEVIVNYERPFVNRTATVLMAISQLVPVEINLGNFLVDWNQWSEGESGDWHQQYNPSANRDEILNVKNQGGRSFWFNPSHMVFDNYQHEYFVQARGGDDDTYGSVFRYNGSSFYSFEWDSGGWGVNGMAIYRNVRTGSGWTKTMLVHNSTRWGANQHYIHKVSIKVLNRRISAQIYRQSGANLIQIATLEYYDNHIDAPLHGAWGPMTASQPNTYFWSLKASKTQLLPPATTPALLKEIPLSYVQLQGGRHIVSEPMSTHFPQEVFDKALYDNGLTTNDIGLVEYWIQGTNVFEGVSFSDSVGMSNVTANSSARIAMTTFNYDGAVLPFNGNIHAVNRGATYQISDTAVFDKQVTSIIIRPQFTRIFDTINVEINGAIIKYMNGVPYGEHVIQLNPPMQLEMTDTVTVTYVANDFELEIYKGEHIDTHDKVFKIEGNKLNWHHVPSYETEETE